MDKRNKVFDETEAFKVNVRKQLTKEAVLGNQEILDHKSWVKDHQQMQKEDDLKKALQKRDEHEQVNFQQE